MSIPSTIEIEVGGTDITHDVIPQGTSFDGAMNAAPGSCQILVRDRTQTHSFTTGDEIVVRLDGQAEWGGYLTQISRRFALPVVDTSVPADVDQRQWVLRGVDFNVLLDKRVLRNTADYLHLIPAEPDGTMDGEMIEKALADYADFPSGFDITSQIDDVALAGDEATDSGAWLQQGTPLRELFDFYAAWSGAVFYVGADKVVYYKSLETQEARWGFSDDPNEAAITTSPNEFQGATIGPRDVEAIESGGPAGMINDALIWGGSEFAGSGTTVFAREQNATSISDHGRWQHAEVHFGERGFKRQAGVDARAETIVNGAPGSVGGDPSRGLRFPQWTISLTWYAHKVPRLSGVPDHLHAGELVTIQLETFNDLTQTLPLRSLSLSFVGLKELEGGPYDPADDEVAWAQFRGTFGLQPSDPYSLWRYLLRMRRQNRASVISTVDGSAEAPYGSLFTGEPTPGTDGTTTIFELPDGRAYIAGTTEVYQDGDLLRRGFDYTESSPTAGEITLTVAPPSSEWLWVVCRIA